MTSWTPSLFSSRVQVYRLSEQDVGGRPRNTWSAQPPPLNRVPCRLDMTFVRPGKDIMPAYEAGKAPDRVGVAFFSPDAGILPGDIIMAVPNDQGRIPVAGTFEIRVFPDVAQGYFDGHHLEVQIIETSQKLAGVFPGSE